MVGCSLKLTIHRSNCAEIYLRWRGVVTAGDSSLGEHHMCTSLVLFSAVNMGHVLGNHPLNTLLEISPNYLIWSARIFNLMNVPMKLESESLGEKKSLTGVSRRHER